MSPSPLETSSNFGLSIAVTKRVFSTHAHYVGEELLQKLDEGKSGQASGGGGASAHIRVDWEGPMEAQGYGIVVYFVMGPPEESERRKGLGRSTKNYTATETQAYNAKVRGLVRTVRIAPPSQAPSGTS